MNILCLDTSGNVLSAALQCDGGTVSLEMDAGGKHSGLLMPVMDNLLKTAGIRPDALDVAACMRGPGSFTGIRIGFAAVQGIAAASGARAVSIPSLDCMVLPFEDLPVVVPAIDSRRQQFYTAVYLHGERITDYLDTKPDTLVPVLRHQENILLTGPNADKLHGALSGLLPETHFSVDPFFSQGQAKNMLHFFTKDSRMKVKWEETLAVPLYVRKSDAEEQWQKKV
jgi:tRNA threonylcarbamoyladenosine biosynthesis protein TsaB